MQIVADGCCLAKGPDFSSVMSANAPACLLPHKLTDWQRTIATAHQLYTHEMSLYSNFDQPLICVRLQVHPVYPITIITMILHQHCA
jgi:hypothetical protein